MPPPRPSGTTAFPPARAATNTVPVFEVIKARILFKLQERFDPAKTRRMPASLLLESARQQVEQDAEAEAHRVSRADRDRLVEEVMREAFGFGPLEELFADPGVKEITILGPQAVIARRDQGWLPTNVKFRDDEHVLEVLHKVGTRGEAVGDPLPSSVLDVKLGNGFRVVAVVPPPALGLPPSVVFVRTADAAAPPPPASKLTGTVPQSVVDTAGGGTRTPPPEPPPETDRPTVPGPRAVRTPAPGDYSLERHRVRITERLIAKLASLGVYDLGRVDPGELRKVIAAYVEEYCRAEHVYLSATDQGRLTLEILTGMKR